MVSLPLWSTLKHTVQECIDDDVPRLSAALAYYAVFSLAPLLLISIAVAGSIFGADAVRGELDDELRRSLGPSGAFAVQDMLAGARRPETNFWVSIAGIVMLLFGAAGVFGQLQAALNQVWDVKLKPGRSIRNMAKDRFVSFTMVLSTGFLLLTSMILTAVLHGVSEYANRILTLPATLWSAISGIGSFAVITLLFAAIFKVLPDVRLRWRHVWVGAMFTSALFVIGKTAMGWYLGREAIASSYGSAGSLALVLLWVYYSSIILLFGAEFTQVWAKAQGDNIKPNRHAMLVKTESR